MQALLFNCNNTTIRQIKELFILSEAEEETSSE
jgi:hypothetical protein